MRIAIVDDVREVTQNIEALLFEYSREKGADIHTERFSSAEDFLRSFYPNTFDLIVMDIYMDGMSGLEAARKVREKDPEVLLVFLTSSPDHMPEAFRVHAYDYLAKPAEESRLFSLMDDVDKRLTKKPEIPTLTFISHRNEINLPYHEIVFITSMGNNLKISTRNGTVYEPRGTFSSFSEQLLQDPRFLVINRGILVNLDHVIRIGEKSCSLPGGVQLPVNVRDSKKIEKVWLNYSIARIRKESLERRVG